MRGPPRWAAEVLSALLPPDERDFVLGDLAEEFAVRQARWGRLRAAVWCWGEVARSAWPLLSYPGRWRRWTVTGLGEDLWGALRILRRAPGFATVVVLTVAIGVGGASAVYSVVRGVVLSPLPFDDPERVVMLWGRSAEYPRAPLTVGDHNALADEVEAFEAVTASWGNTALLLGGSGAEQVSVGWVTPEYFDVLGVRPALGPGLEDGDEDLALLSHGLWIRRWGGDPSVIGRTLDLAGGSLTIAGVLPPDSDPNLTTFAGGLSDYQVWRLQPSDWTRGEDRSVGWLRSTARLRDEVTLAQAQVEVDALMARINATVTSRDGGTDLRIDLIPVRTDLVGRVSRTLWILLGAVSGVLLIAACNVALLVLARGEARRGELAVRTALGGSRPRLVRQLLGESLGLAVAGGTVGFVLSGLGVRALLAVAPPSLPRLGAVQVDGAVFLFALAATSAAAAIFAVVPAVRATRTDPARALGERHATGDRRREGLRRGLVVAQVALSLALLTATGLLLRSFHGLRGVDLGFQTEGVVTFALEVPSLGDTPTEGAATLAAYVDRLEAVPGVRAAGFTNRVPLGGGLFTGTYRPGEMVGAEAEPLDASFRWVTPGFLGAMGARLVAGRGFRPEDGLGTVLVDETAARRAWPGQDPIGRQVETSVIGEEPHLAEVIGVVAPMKHAGVAAPAVETVFLPMLARAREQNFRYGVVRVAGDPADYVGPLREAARAVNANTVLARVRTMDDLFDTDVAATRFALLLLAVFGAVAVVLASVGLHGVMSLSVRGRARELALRVALGARHRVLLGETVASGAAMVVAGIALGAVLSLGLGGVLGSLLFDVRPRDLPTLAGAALLMLGVGLLGAWLPARRVLGVDPAVALREE